MFNFIATAPDVSSPNIFYNISQLLQQIVELLGGPAEIFQSLKYWFGYVFDFIAGTLGMMLNLLTYIPPVFALVFYAMVVVSVVFVIIKLVLL